MRGKENARRGGKKRTRGVISKGRERRNQEEQELEKKRKEKRHEQQREYRFGNGSCKNKCAKKSQEAYAVATDASVFIVLLTCRDGRL